MWCLIAVEKSKEDGEGDGGLLRRESARTVASSIAKPAPVFVGD